MENPIQEYLGEYTKKQTIRGLKTICLKYLEYIYGSKQEKNKKEYNLAPYEKLARKYFKEERDYTKDILGFIQLLESEDKTPRTIGTYVSCIREWFTTRKIELKAWDLKQIKKRCPRGKRAVTHEVVLRENTIAQILSHSDSKMRAIILTLCSSGMRPGEALNLDMDDIDLETRTIWIKDTKTGDSRYSFFTDEALAEIIEWLKVRESYIETAEKRYYTDAVDSSKMFPFSYRVFLKCWTASLQKAGLYKVDKRTNRATLRPHACRKFFSSKLSKTNIGDTFIEALLGHEEGVKSIYKRYNEDEVREKYRENDYAVTIYKGEITKEVEDLKATTVDLASKNTKLERDISDRLSENEERFKELEKKNKQLLDIIRYELRRQHRLLSEHESFDKQLSDLIFAMEQCETISNQIEDYVDPEYIEEYDSESE